MASVEKGDHATASALAAQRAKIALLAELRVGIEAQTTSAMHKSETTSRLIHKEVIRQVVNFAFITGLRITANVYDHYTNAYFATAAILPADLVRSLSLRSAELVRNITAALNRVDSAVNPTEVFRILDAVSQLEYQLDTIAAVCRVVDPGYTMVFERPSVRLAAFLLDLHFEVLSGSGQVLVPGQRPDPMTVRVEWRGRPATDFPLVINDTQVTSGPRGLVVLRPQGTLRPDTTLPHVPTVQLQSQVVRHPAVRVNDERLAVVMSAGLTKLGYPTSGDPAVDVTLNYTHRVLTATPFFVVVAEGSVALCRRGKLLMNVEVSHIDPSTLTGFDVRGYGTTRRQAEDAATQQFAKAAIKAVDLVFTELTNQ